MNALRFRQEDREKDRKGPPNYQSRSVQTKLLVLVFTLMLVIAMAVRARDPANYAWMWKLDQQDEADDPSAKSQNLPSNAPNANSPPNAAASPGKSLSARARIQQDFFDFLAKNTSASHQDSLLRRINQHLTPERDYRVDLSTDGAAGERGQFQAATDTYFEDALASLDDESQEDARLKDARLKDGGDQWRQPLNNVRAAWRELFLSLYPDLPAQTTTPDNAAAEAKNTELDGNLAVALLHYLEESALRQIKDNTMFERHESLAWWTLLRRATDQSKGTSAELTTRLQLAEQSVAYRGRPVQIRGRVLRGYTVEAQPNPFEVSHYNVLWLRPDGGDHLPIAVYCLDLPPGFPELKPLEKEGNALEEEVELTGWFYKHWAYASKTGLSLAPLLVSRSPTWFPKPAPQVNRSNPAIATAQILLAAMAALVIARMVLRWSRWVNVSRQQLAGESRIDELRPEDLGPTIHDALEDMKHRSDEETG